jgi:hypothetical protein
VLMGASICCAVAEADTQFTIFALSALKKQYLIFCYGVGYKSMFLKCFIKLVRQIEAHVMLLDVNPTIPTIKQEQRALSACLPGSSK